MRTIRRMATATVAVACCSASAFALTEGQCLFFAVDGRTAICHAVGSPQKPFIPLDAPIQACIRHAEHPSDHVAVSDPDCQGGGCLPESAPCDTTLPCCEGLVCNDGVCGLPVEDAATSGDDDGGATENGAIPVDPTPRR